MPNLFEFINENYTGDEGGFHFVNIFEHEPIDVYYDVDDGVELLMKILESGEVLYCKNSQYHLDCYNKHNCFNRGFLMYLRDMH